MVGRYLTADRPGDSSMEDKEAILNTTTMRTASLAMPSQEYKRPGQVWNEDAQMRAEL